jgi:hypothetical protein
MSTRSLLKRDDEGRELCDRADIAIERALNCNWISFISPTARASLHATLRIALDMEVEAGGPYPVPVVIDRSKPCPTCGFHIRKTERKPFMFHEDE